MYKQMMEDKRMKAIVRNKSAVVLHGLRPGAEKAIEVDAEGTPLDFHWRRRKADSTIDGCIEIVPIEKNKPVKKNKESE